MTKPEQRAFIRGLCRSVERDLVKTVPKIPTEWDGHELRRLIRDRFALVVFGELGRGRIRRYCNEVRVRGLLNY